MAQKTNNVKINWIGVLKEIEKLILVAIFVSSWDSITHWFLGTFAGVFGMLFVLLIVFARNNMEWMNDTKNKEGDK